MKLAILFLLLAQCAYSQVGDSCFQQNWTVSDIKILIDQSQSSDEETAAQLKQRYLETLAFSVSDNVTFAADDTARVLTPAAPVKYPYSIARGYLKMDAEGTLQTWKIVRCDEVEAVIRQKAMLAEIEITLHRR